MKTSKELEAWYTEHDKKPTAVVGVLESNGLVLAITRWNDPRDWGLIGGTIDPGETPLQAIYREFREETGLALPESCFVPTGFCEIGQTSYSEAFYIQTNYDTSYKFTSSDEGLVAWVPWSEL